MDQCKKVIPALHTDSHATQNRDTRTGTRTMHKQTESPIKRGEAQRPVRGRTRRGTPPPGAGPPARARAPDAMRPVRHRTAAPARYLPVPVSPSTHAPSCPSPRPTSLVWSLASVHACLHRTLHLSVRVLQTHKPIDRVPYMTWAVETSFTVHKQAHIHTTAHTHTHTLTRKRLAKAKQSPYHFSRPQLMHAGARPNGRQHRSIVP